MKLTLLALIGAAAAIHTPTQIKALRYRGGAEDDDDSLFGGDDAAAAPPAMGGMGDMMGGLGGMPGMPTDPAEYEAAMEQLLDSPMMNEFLGDPEKIEQSRQLILQNPMMVNMFKSVPGLEDVVNDKEKWAQQMKEVFTAQRDAYRAKKDASKAGTP